MPDPAASSPKASTIPLFSTLRANARILFVRLRSMGDSLLLTSPLHALKSEFPDFRIAVLVEATFAPCFDGNPDIEEVLTAGRSKLATIRQLFSQRFDTIVNLHGGPTSLAYSLAARGPSVGVEGYQFGRLYSLLIPRTSKRQHTVETTMELFRNLGLKAEDAPPLVYAPQPDAASWVRQNVGTQSYAVIHPGALMSTKRWSPEGFGAVGARLWADGLKPVLTAGPGEERVVADTARHLPDSLILLGLSIPRLAELIRGAALYVGNDSGPMHLAAAVGTPIAAVWGSSDSTRWRPWQVEHKIIQNSFDCNPCPGYRCLVARSPLCIESVTIDQVADATDSLIHHRVSADHSEVGHRDVDHGH